jgi:hypothetical protein
MADIVLGKRVELSLKFSFSLLVLLYFCFTRSQLATAEGLPRAWTN